MTDLPPVPAVRRGGTLLTLSGLLNHQHRRGRLLTWLSRAATEAFLLDQARALGLAVDTIELQQSSDLFRRRRGLLTAEQTHNWLGQRRLSADDFEAGLEASLLLGKLRRHVTDGPAAERFNANPGDFDRFQLRLVVVPTVDLAREVLSQVSEEGADLADLARRHSSHASAAGGGVVTGFRFRFSEPIRQALAAAAPGTLVGPVATPRGFAVFRVEEKSEAVLDAETAAVLTRVVFGEWLREQLARAEYSVPLLGDPA